MKLVSAESLPLLIELEAWQNLKSERLLSLLK